MTSESLDTVFRRRQCALHVDMPAARADEAVHLAQQDGVDCHVMDVSNIFTEQDLYNYAEREFAFPSAVNNGDAFLDWMSDFEWIDNQVGYIVVVKNIGTLQSNHHHSFKLLVGALVRAVELFQHSPSLRYHGFICRDIHANSVDLRSTINHWVEFYGPHPNSKNPRVSKEIPVIYY